MKRILFIVFSAVLISLSAAGCAVKTDQETIADNRTLKEEEPYGTAAESTAETAGNVENAAYEFTEDNFPEVMASDSALPLGMAVENSLLAGAGDQYWFECGTDECYRYLMDENSSCALILAGEPGPEVMKEMDASGFEYEMEEIAADALVFVVDKDNPVDDLTTDQIRDIYSGKITSWQQVGGNDAPVNVFQRDAHADSQNLMQKLVMKDTPMADAQTTLIVGGYAADAPMPEKSVKLYDYSANAIGYSCFYYAEDMTDASGIKIISVNGIEPCEETIRSGEYPLIGRYYCVIGSDQPQSGPVRTIFDWLMSKDGQKLVANQGYCPAKDPDELKSELPDGRKVRSDVTYCAKGDIQENRYTRLSDGPMGTLKPAADYGFIYPYQVSVRFASDRYGQGTLSGFFDEHSRLITDPIYNQIMSISDYDVETDKSTPVPVWVMSRFREDADDYMEESESVSFADLDIMEYSFAAMDGSFVCDKWYDSLQADEGLLICKYIDSPGFDVYDISSGRLTPFDVSGHWNFDEHGEGADLQYRNGLYLLQVSYDEMYFIDGSGGNVVGPYQTARPFLNERAVVKKAGTSYDMNSCGVVDRDGKWIIKPEYGTVYRLGNGNFLCDRIDGTYEVRDLNGDPVNTIDGLYFYPTAYGFYGRNVQEGLKCCDFDGNTIFDDPTGEWRSIGNNGVIYRRCGVDIELRNIKTGAEAYVKDADGVDKFDTEIEEFPYLGRLEVCLASSDIAKISGLCGKKVYDNDLNLLLETSEDPISPIQDVFNGKWYFDCRFGSRICDSEFKEIWSCGNSGRIVNDKFITDNVCYDKNGDIRFSYSMPRTFGK